MPHITLQTLVFSISALVFDRCRLIDRINLVAPEVEEEEHLADTLFQMDQSLGELADLYAEARKLEGGGRDFEVIYSSGEEAYRQYRAELGQDRQ